MWMKISSQIHTQESGPGERSLYADIPCFRTTLYWVQSFAHEKFSLALRVRSAGRAAEVLSYSLEKFIKDILPMIDTV